MPQNPPRYFPPNYFAGGYWSGSELPEGSVFASISGQASVSGTLGVTEQAPTEVIPVRSGLGAARGSQKHVDTLTASAVVNGGVRVSATATVTQENRRRPQADDDDRVLLELVAAFLNTQGQAENGIVV